jgi:uncharacterized membrane protein (UPF0136 family)
MKKGLYAFLLAITILATAGGVVTLIPREAASYPSILGYRSVCTFAPAATLFCFAVAGVSCFLRASLAKETSGTPRQRMSRHFRAIVPIALVVLLGLGSTVWYAVVKVRYSDAATRATAHAGE